MYVEHCVAQTRRRSNGNTGNQHPSAHEIIGGVVEKVSDGGHIVG